MSLDRRLGPYQLLRHLGGGGCGQLWVGRHLETGAIHALKLLVLGDATSLLRFEREAVAAARLGEHPHAVQVHASFVEAGRGVIATDLIEGSIDLQVILSREGPLPPARALQLVREVATAVAHGHAAGVLHRDLKPSNVLVDPDGRARLVDLGLADLVSERSLTQTGEVLGTPTYMAPEQALGQASDPRVDVFGLGALLFACLTGEPPRRPGPLVQVLARAATVPVPPLRSLRPDLPEWLEEVVARATAFDPAKRFASVNELLLGLHGNCIAPATGSRKLLRGALILLATTLLGTGALYALGRPTTGPATVPPSAQGAAGVWSATPRVRELLRALKRADGPTSARDPCLQLSALGSIAQGAARESLSSEVLETLSAEQNRLIRLLLADPTSSTTEEDWASCLAAVASASVSFGQGDRLVKARTPLWSEAARTLSTAADKGDDQVLAVGCRVRALLQVASGEERAAFDAALSGMVRQYKPGGPHALRLESARRLLLGFPLIDLTGWSSSPGEGTGVHHLVLAIRDGSVGAAHELVGLASWKRRDLSTLRQWRKACPRSRNLAWAELWLQLELEQRPPDDPEHVEPNAEVRAQAASILVDPDADDDVGDLSGDRRDRRVEIQALACKQGLEELSRQGRSGEVERSARRWLDRTPGAPPDATQHIRFRRMMALYSLKRLEEAGAVANELLLESFQDPKISVHSRLVRAVGRLARGDEPGARADSAAVEERGSANAWRLTGSLYLEARLLVAGEPAFRATLAELRQTLPGDQALEAVAHSLLPSADQH